jgi:hypothetical protein
MTRSLVLRGLAFWSQSAACLMRSSNSVRSLVDQEPDAGGRSVLRSRHQQGRAAQFGARVYLGAVGEQHANFVEIACRLQERCCVELVFGGRIGSGVQEELHAFGATGEGRVHQWSVAARVLCVDGALPDKSRTAVRSLWRIAW